MNELKKEFTIIIVTHNMHQAARVADYTAFFNAEAVGDKGNRLGYLVEIDQTHKIFTNPVDEHTRDYVSGKFG